MKTLFKIDNIEFGENIIESHSFDCIKVLNFTL